MPDAMNRQRAAGRGALVAVLWASALLALLDAVRTTQYAHGLFTLADVIFDPRAFQAGPVRVIAASLVAAAIVGAGVSMLGRRIGAPGWTRAILLSLVSFPALYVATRIHGEWVREECDSASEGPARSKRADPNENEAAAAATKD